MAPTILTLLRRHLPSPSDIQSLGPLAAHTLLLARDGDTKDDPEVKITHPGVIHPNEVNNNAVFAVFGLLGAGFVIVGIWFFFWAKNGGFYFKEGDWDDYKSTVLRRPKIGPNGTVYSDVTASTVLGGGSVYKDVDDRTVVTGVTRDGGRDDDLTTVVSATTGITGITGGVSDFSGREKRRMKREQKEREKERKREDKRREKERKSRRKVGADGDVVDEEAEKLAEEQLRMYRHEKAARVGGINREADGSEWDGSTNPSWSEVSPSGRDMGESTVDGGSEVTEGLMAGQQRTPKKEEKKERGIRKVYSTADKTAVRENEKIRAEARKLREEGRRAAAQEKALQPRESRRVKRDFSFTAGAEEAVALRRIDEGSEVMSEGTSANTYSDYKRARSKSRPRPPPSEVSSSMPGGWAQSEVSAATASTEDSGTKVYKHSHHIPVASAVSDFAYAEDKRKRRGGAGARRERERTRRDDTSSVD
ncbi:hypothetical protein QBC41DRAFT_72220 [Cercophora samala]|uniref:Endosomal spry domain-containing protein n=1 Tax=Cercophora samala TaxID=330535 RepID=A0AA39ZMZ7_9PEZI|nr:hypothetical protein QBC41DRAFT_72220 [Cercophora samala]